MAKSLKQVVEQIRKLEREAEALRKNEVSGVIDRIRTAIDHYALTPQDLFGSKAGGDSSTAAKATRRRSTSGTAAAAKRARSGIPKYAHGDGRTWTGTGKRPGWFLEALASGKTADDMLIGNGAASGTKAGTEAGTVAGMDAQTATGAAARAGRSASRATSTRAKRAAGHTQKAGKNAGPRQGVNGKGSRNNAAKKAQGVPKYHDGSGRTWTGVGKRPNWFVQALAAGRTSDELLIPTE